MKITNRSWSDAVKWIHLTVVSVSDIHGFKQRTCHRLKAMKSTVTIKGVTQDHYTQFFSTK